MIKNITIFFILVFVLFVKFYVYTPFKEGIKKKNRMKKRKKKNRMKKRKKKNRMKKRKKKKKKRTKHKKISITCRGKCCKYENEDNYDINCDQLATLCGEKTIDNCIGKGPDCINMKKRKGC